MKRYDREMEDLKRELEEAERDAEKQRIRARIRELKRQQVVGLTV